MANMTYSVVHILCNKLMIGKTYWQSVVVPAVLMGSSVVCWTKVELETMHRIENGVWRAVLGAPGYAPVVTLQGVVGTSKMLTRDLKTKICYEKYLMENGNELLKETYLETMRENMGEWSRTVREYRRTLEISEERLRNISREEFKHKIQMRDSMR